MGKAEKRVTLAKDVILQLELQRLIAYSGDYICGLNLTFDENGKLIKNDVELQSILPTQTCRVCAKGAFFIADIMRRDKMKISEAKHGIGNEKIVRRLSDIFTRNQLDLIETAFEKSVIYEENETLMEEKVIKSTGDVDYIYTPLAKKAISFGKKYKDTTNRMIAIMNNIIKNNGEFKP
jgi:hypothetical protein